MSGNIKWLLNKQDIDTIIPQIEDTGQWWAIEHGNEKSVLKIGVGLGRGDYQLPKKDFAL